MSVGSLYMNYCTVMITIVIPRQNRKKLTYVSRQTSNTESMQGGCTNHEGSHNQSIRIQSVHDSKRGSEIIKIPITLRKHLSHHSTK
jgi:hypothetical protein